MSPLAKMAVSGSSAFISFESVAISPESMRTPLTCISPDFTFSARLRAAAIVSKVSIKSELFGKTWWKAVNAWASLPSVAFRAITSAWAIVPLGFLPSLRAAKTLEVASIPAARAARAAQSEAWGLKARLVPNSKRVMRSPAASRILAALVAIKVW